MGTQKLGPGAWLQGAGTWQQGIGAAALSWRSSVQAALSSGPSALADLSSGTTVRAALSSGLEAAGGVRRSGLWRLRQLMVLQNVM